MAPQQSDEAVNIPALKPPTRAIVVPIVLRMANCDHQVISLSSYSHQEMIECSGFFLDFSSDYRLGFRLFLCLRNYFLGFLCCQTLLEEWIACRSVDGSETLEVRVHTLVDIVFVRFLTSILLI